MKYPLLLFIAVIPVVLASVQIALSGKAFEQFYTYSPLKDKGSMRGRYMMIRNMISVLVCAGIVAVIIALVRPTSTKLNMINIPDKDSSSVDYSFVVDISVSMTADDGGVSRIERVKEGLISFIYSDSASSRYSVTVFKGRAAVLIPLSSDKNLVSSVIENLSPDMFTSRGSALTPAVEAGISLFPDHEKSERRMILFTDGEESSLVKFSDSIDRLSGLILEKNIYTSIYVPDISTGSSVSDGENIHISIPDLPLLEKSSEKWGGSTGRFSDFKISDIEKMPRFQSSVTDYSQYFLVLSFVFLFSAAVLRRFLK